MTTEAATRQVADGEIVISGLGLVTAVGLTVEASCASLRAGIVRVRDIDGLEVEAADGATEPLQGHPIGEIPDGFFQFGRWVRTGAACIRDLQRHGALPSGDGARSAFWKRTGARFVTPVVEIDRFLWSLDMVPDGLQRFYLDPLLDLLECSVPREHRRAFPLGHAGIAEAVRTGRDDLARGLLDRVLIVGVDSYLDDLTVSWLARDDRLKTGEHATGVLPGEAGACVMLERGAAAAARRARADARVLAAALRPASRVPSRPSEADIPALGRRLAAAAIEALDAVPGARPFRGDLILDLNGENWRASAWGYAQIHLRDAVDFDGCREILPTVSFGEIGAATGPAALCVAARSWARGYALGDRALICNVSDTGAVGAVVLGAPATPFRGSGPNGAASLLQRAGAAESPASISRSTSP